MSCTNSTPARTRRDRISSICRSWPTSGNRSELQVQSCVDAVRWRIQRTASQLEHAVVHSQPQRANQIHFHAAAGVEGEARVLVCVERLAIQTAARREVRLEAEDRKRRLQQQIAAAGGEG